MSILDKVAYSSKYGNVGQPTGGFPSLDHFTGMLLHFDGFEVSEANLASYALFQTALQTATLAAIDSRLFPVMHIQGATDNTPAVETKTAPYGNKVSQVEKPHSYTFELENWGIGWFAEARKFNGRLDMRAFFVTPSLALGEKTDTGFQGFEVSVNFEQVKVGNVADYTKYMVNVEITDPQALSENVHAVEVPEGTILRNKLKGITSVTLSSPAATKVKAVKTINNQDLYDLYADALNKAAAWVLTDSITGAIVTPSVVAKDATNKAWVFTYTNAYPVNIKLAAPSVLAALTPAVGTVNTGGFEAESEVGLGELNYLIAGGTISNGGSVKLTIDSDKVGWVKLPNGSLLETVSGVVDSTYSGVGGNITYYIPKSQTGTVDIKDSSISGDISTDVVAGFDSTNCDLLTSITAQYLEGLNSPNCNLLTSIGGALLQAATCNASPSLTTLFCPKATTIYGQGCALTAKSIGDILYSAYIDNRASVAFNFSGGTNALQSTIDTYLQATHGVTVATVTTKLVTDLGGVVTLRTS